MTLGPLQLTPRLVEKPWGGHRLQGLGRELPAGATVGESWEVADLPQAATSVPQPWTTVVHGVHAGRRICELIAEDRDAVLGTARSVAGHFPLLVKLLDAREHLSVQVHPPSPYVAQHPGAALKTETWVVLDADPGASLFLGFQPEVTLDEVQDALGTPALVDLLQSVPARRGQVHHVPAGTVHALGAGVLVAEVQTPSDTTFRLYDWSDEYGRAPRALHLDAGMASLAASWPAPSPDPAGGTQLPLRTEHYDLERVQLLGGACHEFASGVARVLLLLDGRLMSKDLAGPVDAGRSILLPAAWDGSLRAVGRTTLLLATPH